MHHNSFNNVDGAETKFGLILLAWIVSRTEKIDDVPKMVVGLPQRLLYWPHNVRRMPTVVNESTIGSPAEGHFLPS